MAPDVDPDLVQRVREIAILGDMAFVQYPWRYSRVIGAWEWFFGAFELVIAEHAARAAAEGRPARAAFEAPRGRPPLPVLVLVPEARERVPCRRVGHESLCPCCAQPLHRHQAWHFGEDDFALVLHRGCTGEFFKL